MDRRSPLPLDLEERLASLGSALASSPGLVFAYLFGSAARGGLTQQSDVDLAVYLAPTSDLDEGRLAAIRIATQHLGTDAVDVVVLNTAPSALLARVLPERRVLCDREPFLRHRFESLEGRKAADFRIFERRLLERRLARG